MPITCGMLEQQIGLKLLTHMFSEMHQNKKTTMAHGAIAPVKMSRTNASTPEVAGVGVDQTAEGLGLLGQSQHLLPVVVAAFPLPLTAA